MQYTTQQEKRRDGTGAAPIVFRFVALATLALAAPLSAQQVSGPPQTMATYNAGEKGKVIGAIISRNGDTLMVRRENSNEISTVSLSQDTRVESPSGLLNIDRKRQDLALLVPGLFVKVRGRGGPNGNLIAERISFHKTALKVANQISAGEVDLRAQIDANTDSLVAAKARARDSLAAFTVRARDSLAMFRADLDAYDVKYTGTVNFATGSATLSEEAKQQLDGLMAQGKGLTGYIVEIAGFTDAVGSPAYNQRLSERRTDAVVAYLAKANVPLRRIVNPTGLGEAKPIGSNSTAEGRAENRRVEVKVLVNRATEQTRKP